MDKAPREIYISERINQWMRSPTAAGKSADQSNSPGEWHVLVLHHRSSDKEYISDVFIYDICTHRLHEVILGIHYRRIPKALLAKAISSSDAPHHRAFEKRHSENIPSSDFAKRHYSLPTSVAGEDPTLGPGTSSPPEDDGST